MDETRTNESPKRPRTPSLGIVEDVLCIDIRAVGFATEFKVGSTGLVFWQYSDELTPKNVQIEILNDSELLVRHWERGMETRVTLGYSFTTPNYGGKRYWFQCYQCDRRASRLYLLCNFLRCRNCHRLVHRSTRTCHVMERAQNWIEKYWKEVKEKEASRKQREVNCSKASG
jgi:hypothetical protein